MKTKWIILVILSSFAVIITGINFFIIMGVNAREISGERDSAAGREHIAEIALNLGDLLSWNIECQSDFQVYIWDWLSDNPIQSSSEHSGFFIIEWSSESYLITIRVYTEYGVYMKYSFKIIPLMLLIASNLAISITGIIVMITSIRSKRKRIRKEKL